MKTLSTVNGCMLVLDRGPAGEIEIVIQECMIPCTGLVSWRRDWTPKPRYIDPRLHETWREHWSIAADATYDTIDAPERG